MTGINAVRSQLSLDGAVHKPVDEAEGTVAWRHDFTPGMPDRFELRLEPDGVYRINGLSFPSRDYPARSVDHGKSVLDVKARSHDRVGVLGTQRSQSSQYNEIQGPLNQFDTSLSLLGVQRRGARREPMCCPLSLPTRREESTKSSTHSLGVRIESAGKFVGERKPFQAWSPPRSPCWGPRKTTLVI